MISNKKSVNEIINPNMYYLIDMIKSNLFPLYEEENKNPNTNWTNMELVYKLLYKIISTIDCEKKAFKYIGFYFTNDLINLIKTEVNDERDIIKLILHKIYEKRYTLRIVIRTQIGEFLDKIIKNNKGTNGVYELLEILTTIISGLKENFTCEYRDYFNDIIIPLHKNKEIDSFFKILNECSIKYIEKENELAYPLLEKILDNWPNGSYTNEKLLLKELSDILDYINCSKIEPYSKKLFKILIKCLGCSSKEIFNKSKEIINKKIFRELLFNYSDLCYEIILPGVFYLSQNHENEEAKKGFSEISLLFENNNKELYDKYKYYKIKDEDIKLETKWVKEEINNENKNKKNLLKSSKIVKVEEEEDEEEKYFGICPITQQIIQDPVKSPSGIYYERSAILKWLEKNHNDPMTRKHLTNDMLIEDEEYNIKLRNFKKEHGIPLYEDDDKEDDLDQFLANKK